MIRVLSMDSVSNMDVTSYYMHCIYEACSSVNKTRWFTFNEKAEKSDLLIVTTVIEALRLLLKGYKHIGIWIQGVLPEESFMKHESFFRKAILEIIERIALKKSCILFLVSEEMLNHYEKKYNINIKNKSVIMPCFNASLTNESFSHPERYKDLVFCYVGSLAPWQCFEETVSLFSKINDKYPNSKMTVFTHEIESAKKMCEYYNIRCSIKSCTNQELQDELKKVTYGFIIRDDTVVNNVATPTKISSYLANGVIPIYTSSLKSFCEAAKDLKSFIEINTTSDIDSLLYSIEHPSEYDEIVSDISKIYEEYYNKDYYLAIIAEKIRELVL